MRDRAPYQGSHVPLARLVGRLKEGRPTRASMWQREWGPQHEACRMAKQRVTCDRGAVLSPTRTCHPGSGHRPAQTTAQSLYRAQNAISFNVLTLVGFTQSFAVAKRPPIHIGTATRASTGPAALFQRAGAGRRWA